MADPFQEAKNLFPDVNRLIEEIQAAGTEVARLESSKSSISDEKDPAVFHSRLRRARGALSELKDDLIQMVDQLAQFTPKIVDLSNRYRHDAGLYGKTAQYAGVDRARYQVEQAASYAIGSSQERNKQVEEVRLMIQRANSALNKDFGFKPFGPNSSPTSIDSLLGEALVGLESYSSSYQVDVSYSGTYHSVIDSNIYSGFPGYRPGAYSLYSRENLNVEGRSISTGMEWIR